MSRAVIDQPGIRLLSFGLLISLVFGYLLKGAISDQKVERYLDSSLSQLQKDFHFDYESAHVNLSKWGLPLPVLEISNIRLSPKSIACHNSQVYIDLLEIPFSFKMLEKDFNIVPKLRARNVEFRIDEQEKCFVSESEAEEKAVGLTRFGSDPRKIDTAKTSILKTESSATTSQSEEVGVHQSGYELTELKIEKVKLILSKNPDQPIVLKQVAMELNFQHKILKSAQLKSRLSALKDLRSDIYFINSDLTLTTELKENGKHLSTVHLDGKLLDGDIQMFAQHESGSTKINYELNLSKVSAKALSPILKKEFQRSSSVTQKIPMAISFESIGSAIVGTSPKLESHINNLMIALDTATITLTPLKISFDEENGLKVLPFEATVENLLLSKLKNTDLLEGRFDSFENLGELSGKIIFKNEKDVSFSGFLKNLEVVFSNRGRRDFQKIDEMKLDFVFRSDKLLFEANSLLVSQKPVIGGISGYFTRDQKEVEVKMKLSDISLNPRVWEQFTFIEQSPLVSVVWSYQKRGASSSTEQYDLKIDSDSLEVPGISFGKLALNIKQYTVDELEDSVIQGTLKPVKVETNSRLFENRYVNAFIVGDLGFDKQTFSSEKVTVNFQGKNWRNLGFSVDAQLAEDGTKMPLRVSLKGEVSQRQGLKSKLSLNFRNKDFTYELGRAEQSEEIIFLPKFDPEK